MEKQLHQTIGSVKNIRETFGLDYGVLAFPHTDAGVTLDFFMKVQESGLVDITFGSGGMIDSDVPSHLKIISLENPPLPAAEALKWQYARRYYRQLNGPSK